MKNEKPNDAYPKLFATYLVHFWKQKESINFFTQDLQN